MKKKNTKKLLSVVFMFLLVFAINIVVHAEDTATYTEGLYTYILENGEATIISVDDSISGNVVIPDTLNGYPVTKISYSAFLEKNYLTGIVIGNNVKEIGQGAFWGCKNLVTVDLPDYIESLPGDVFARCTKLENIDLPDTVKYMGSHLFSNCESLKNINIPEGVESLGKDTFGNCKSLKSITLPKSMKTLNYSVFTGCSNLETLTILGDIEYIGFYAFKDCVKLNEINIIGSIESLDYDVFDNTAYYNNSDNWINDMLYLNTYLIEAKEDISGTVSILEGTTLISNQAFREFSEITAVSIPGSVKKIGSYTFYDCDNLETATIGEGVETIGYSAFGYCPKLRSVEIPTSITTIETYAFWNCGLEEIVIPDSVTVIEDNVFKNTELKKVYFTGTEEEWKNITISEGNDTLFNAEREYCKNIHEHIYYACVLKESTCLADGSTNYSCSCGDTYIEIIPAIGHLFDSDNETCQICGFDRTDNCSCNCHKGGIAGFFFKFILFFQKIFKANRECKCGIAHY